MGTSEAFPSSSGGKPGCGPDAKQRGQRVSARWLPRRVTLATLRGLLHAGFDAVWQLATSAKRHSRAVWQAARQARGPLATGEPPSWLDTFRRWSPGFVPPVIGTLLLL